VLQWQGVLWPSVFVLVALALLYRRLRRRPATRP
jgi:hypothetical protein